MAGKKEKSGMTAKAKKKNAIASAAIKKGTGKIRVNKRDVLTLQPAYITEFILEPLELAGSTAQEVDIDITTKGGGFMGQAVAARAAIAKSILDYRHGDEKLKKRMIAYDRMLLVDDPRRVEPKKQLGPKARAKKQKSKR
ncbi:MAG: 30S ribosomal protein S9 [archaeon]|nr:30S ribosomal protein S9 [archaeon]